jgi:hypothetical protein
MKPPARNIQGDHAFALGRPAHETNTEIRNNVTPQPVVHGKW